MSKKTRLEFYNYAQDGYYFVTICTNDRIECFGKIKAVGVGRDRHLRKIKIKPLPELIGAFKTTSSKMIHNNKFQNFRWQRSFYDQIIKNDKSLDNIRKYINNNPLKWDLDRNNPKNI